MINIPPQIQKGWRFIKVMAGQKLPVEKDWQNTNNYDFESFQEYRKIGTNYGVLGGKGRVIIDIDKKSPDFEEAHNAAETLPETFTVETANGGFHYYYKCPDIDKGIRLQNEAGEIRAKGMYVVGPHSELSGNKKYVPIKFLPVATIKKADIERVFAKWIKKEVKIPQLDKIENKPKKSNPITSKIRLVMNWNKNLKNTLTGLTKRKFGSNSEKEMSIVVNLIRYDFSFEEIDEIMKQFQTGKWEDAHHQYKTITYGKAKVFAEKLPLDSLAKYLKIKIESIKIYPSKEEFKVEILTDAGEINLDKLTITGCTRFRAVYYSQTGWDFLPPLPSETWAELLSYWTEYFGQKMPPEKTTEEITAEKIISEIKEFTITDKIEGTLFFGRCFIKNESTLIPNNSIETLLKKNKSNITMSELAYHLKDYLTRNSKTVRIGKRVLRFWFFNTQKLDE